MACCGNGLMSCGRFSQSCDPFVLEHAHRLARIGARDDRVLVGRVDDDLLVEAAGMRLGRGDEARAHPHALRAERQSRGEAASVDDRACGDHRDFHRVDDLRDERHARDAAGVAAGLGALRDDGIQSAGFGGCAHASPRR